MYPPYSPYSPYSSHTHRIHEWFVNVQDDVRGLKRSVQIKLTCGVSIGCRTPIIVIPLLSSLLSSMLSTCHVHSWCKHWCQSGTANCQQLAPMLDPSVPLLFSTIVPSHVMPLGNSSGPPHIYADRGSVETILAITPLSLLTLTICVLCYSTIQSPETNQSHSFIRSQTNPSPSLTELLATIVDALDHENVPYWLMPRQFFRVPAASSHFSEFSLTPWQEGVDLAVFQQNIIQILLAQATLQQHGIIAVESYFGLRFYHNSATHHHHYDFRTPFVDLFYFTARNRTLVNSCCDCGPVTIGPCTKKLCSCLKCVFPENNIFPLTSVHIQSLRRNLTAPRDTSSLSIPSAHPAVHPTAFTSVHSLDTV